MPDPRVAVVIPARYGATRFPGKLLALLGGRSVIAHVIARARAATLPGSVIVATDDDRIGTEAAAAGAVVMRTSPAHPSGTDRVAEVARALPESVEVLVNLQGDEPCIPPAAIDRCAEPVLADKAVDIATLAHIVDEAAAQDPNAVKVVCDLESNALYFSRLPIPFVRDRSADAPRPGAGRAPLFRRHIGIYAFRRAALLRLAALPPTPLECAERLEQLRALEHGMTMRVELVPETGPGVDTEADLARAEAHLARAASGHLLEG
jgi:3-deoxy-manno-octulosonate cytidylyltransferase (CMP-KDO synthetase)